ncbi:MAG: hypothetical protein ACHQYO_00230 [Halanaerobiales bacterium]|jgi:hypothetical protein
MRKFKGRAFFLLLLLALILLAIFLFFPELGDIVPADAIQI